MESGEKTGNISERAFDKVARIIQPGVTPAKELQLSHRERAFSGKRTRLGQIARTFRPSRRAFCPKTFTAECSGHDCKTIMSVGFFASGRGFSHDAAKRARELRGK